MSARAPALGGAALVVAGAVSIQTSAALVIPAFVHLGAASTSAWRFAFGAVILLLLTRPRVGSWTRAQWRGAIVMGLSTAFMNMCFYQALARIPLGTAVTIEFLGPLAVAVFGRHSWVNAAWAILGAFGVVLLSHPGGGVTFVGALFALGSGVGWGGYVFASHRVGGDTPGFAGLAVAMSVAALVTAPWSLSRTSDLAQHPGLASRLALVAALSIVAGFAAEMQALRLVTPAVVGVLLSFDPAVAFAVGAIGLHEHATIWVLTGLACVVVAGVGVTWSSASVVAPRDVG